MREAALRNRHIKIAERLTEHTQRLSPLSVGDFVRIQNQTGPHPLKWDKTGCVVEMRQFDQYVVRVDGSGRVTVRNRKFLRKYTPVYLPPAKHTIGLNVQPPSSASKSVPAAPAKHIPSAPCVQPVDIPSARLTLETQTDNSDQRDPPLMNTPDMTPPVIPTPDIHIPPPGTPVHVETSPLDVPLPLRDNLLNKDKVYRVLHRDALLDRELSLFGSVIMCIQWSIIIPGLEGSLTQMKAQYI